MLLENVTAYELAGMLKRHMRKPAWPNLDDPAARRRAARHAKKYGIWTGLTEKLNHERTIPVIKRSEYREFQRTGSRTAGESALGARRGQTDLTALALWLGHPAADIDFLQDLLWSWCEMTTWIMPAHEGCNVDLGSSAIGLMLSEILWLFDGMIEPEVKERVGAEIDRRILDAATDWRHPDWWRTAGWNWNHVCNANLIMTALYRIGDVETLAAYIHPLCQRMDYALQGFAGDGGCVEGPGYWDYGFGAYLDAAVSLRHRTGGKLNIMQGERIRRICRYPLATVVDGSLRATFSDSAHGFISAGTAMKINMFCNMPELYEIARRHTDGTLVASGRRDLAIHAGQRASGKTDRKDYFLPDLGQVKMRPARRKDAVLAAIAGRNDVPHNHNDIGSFMLYRNGKVLLTDPGAPIYTRKVFSPQRYEILFCRSRGHSVPVINGMEQSAGRRSVGKMRATGLDLDGNSKDRFGTKSAVIDMTRAYRDKTLKSLVRSLALAPDGRLSIKDEYVFSRKPRCVEEAFVTYEPARAVKGGKGVIVDGAKGISITCAVPGRFVVTRLVRESEEGRTGRTLSRITFAPESLSRKMTLAFSVD